jgi:hypothetical protein
MTQQPSKTTNTPTKYLSIQAMDITHVLLADGWHEVRPGSFNRSAYMTTSELTWEDGFHFDEKDGGTIVGAKNAILAAGAEAALPPATSAPSPRPR